MALATKNVKVTVDEFLARENASEAKHEFNNGFIYGMVGASRHHNLISLSIASEIRQQLKGKPCRTYMSDMKVRIKTETSDVFYYPDVMVSCDNQPPSDYYEEKPSLIIEVLSPSTESKDKLEKLSAYTSIPSLTEYLTIAQDKVKVDCYSIVDGQLLLTEYTSGEVIKLDSIGIELLVKDIYVDLVGNVIDEV